MSDRTVPPDQNLAVRTKCQEEGPSLSGLVGDPQQSLSSGGAGRERADSSPVPWPTQAVDFQGHACVLLHDPSPRGKITLKDTGQKEGQVEANHPGHRDTKI